MKVDIYLKNPPEMSDKQFQKLVDDSREFLDVWFFAVLGKTPSVSFTVLPIKEDE